MFFILSKTIAYLLMPIFWVFALLLLAAFSKNPRRQKRWLWASLGLLFFLSNPFLINLMMLQWEIPPRKLTDLPQEKYAVGVVLTGITKYQKTPRDRVYFDRGADRLMHALWLYREGKIDKILITGGIVLVSGKTYTSEAQQLARVLRQAQVPAEDIIIEDKARNTRENALFTAKILKEKFPNQAFLLITSAFHMRRARACFERVGLKPEVFSTDFLTYNLAETSYAAFLPTEGALQLWQVFTHELLGFVVYKLVGYA